MGKKYWNVDEVCKIINPKRGYQTCFGEAVTYSRRCERSIAGGSIFTLNDLAARSPEEAARSPQLRTAAEQGLCYQHKHQLGNVVDRWRRRLEALSGQAGCKVNSDCDSKPDPDYGENIKTESDNGDWDGLARKFDEFMCQFWNMSKKLGKEAEVVCELERFLAKTKAEEKASEEESRRREEAEEQRKREKEAEERRREERERQEQERRDQERKEQDEMIRQRARERAQAREEAERNEWTDSFKVYESKWASVVGIAPAEVSDFHRLLRRVETNSLARSQPTTSPGR